MRPKRKEQSQSKDPYRLAQRKRFRNFYGASPIANHQLLTKPQATSQ